MSAQNQAKLFQPGSTVNVKKAYRDSFGDGVTDRTIISDPLGAKTGEPGYDIRSEIRKNLDPEYKLVDDLMEDGASFREAMAHLGTVKKGLNTTDYTLPVFPQEDLTVLTTRSTPFWDLLPKMTSDTLSVDQDSVTDVSAAQIGGERSVPADSDDTYQGQSLSMTYYRVRGSVSGPMQLASSTLRNAQSVEQQNKTTSMAHFSADLVLNGNPTDGTTDGSTTDERGYTGVRQLAIDGGETTAAGGATITVEDVRSNYQKAVEGGGNPNAIVHITDWKTLTDLKNALDDVNQVEITGGPDGTINFGAKSVAVDGTPVLPSDFMPNTAYDSTANPEGRNFLTADMTYHSVHDLSSTVMEPLAKTEDADEFFMKRYSVFQQAAGATKYTHLLRELE